MNEIKIKWSGVLQIRFTKLLQKKTQSQYKTEKKKKQKTKILHAANR